MFSVFVQKKDFFFRHFFCDKSLKHFVSDLQMINFKLCNGILYINVCTYNFSVTCSISMQIHFSFAVILSSPPYRPHLVSNKVLYCIYGSRRDGPLKRTK